MMHPRKLQDTTIECFDQLLNDGTLGEMEIKALSLVEQNEGLTVRELLEIGVQQGVYARADRNLIAPRITCLAENCIIIRPHKRLCSITGKRVMTHSLAPPGWAEHRRFLRKTWPGKKFVVHRLEVESKTTPNLYHTVVWWTDGSVTCTCNRHYHRPMEYRCHHALGLIKAVTGRDPSIDHGPVLEKEKGVVA